MRLPWNKSKEVQLDLLDAEPGATASHQAVAAAPRAVVSSRDAAAISPAAALPSGRDGRPMLVAVSMLYEDAHNPRTEFPEDSLAELAEDIEQRGVLQPLVVHPADGDGRHRVHFGAKRLRAAVRAGLHELSKGPRPQHLRRETCALSLSWARQWPEEHWCILARA